MATSVGYAGGWTENPTYRQVCGKDSGHAEVVRVEFDPDLVAYDRLLEAFFEMHNPTHSFGGKSDTEGQYRSCVFTTSPEQHETALRMRDDLQARLGRRVITQIEPAPHYWLAEDYHQQYYEKKGIRL